MMCRKIVLLVVVVLPWTAQAEATDRYFRDIVAVSPNRQYEVRAESPDNKSKVGHVAFQTNFVYTFIDKKAGKTLLLSTHRMDQVEKLCDSICLINNGEAVLGASAQFFRLHSPKLDITGDFKLWPSLTVSGRYRIEIEGKFSMRATCCTSTI